MGTGLHNYTYTHKHPTLVSMLSLYTNLLTNVYRFFFFCSRRSRARRTRQSRQATQPVPSDILERIKKHDEEVSRSEDSSDSSNSTPPQKRRDEEKSKPLPMMSAYKPSARPASKVLNQLPSQQTLWSMPASRKKEPAVSEPPPKEKGIVGTERGGEEGGGRERKREREREREREKRETIYM